MSDRPSWFARKRWQLSRNLFRLMVARRIDRELQDAGIRVWRYDETIDRLRTRDRDVWRLISLPANRETFSEHWFLALRDRAIRTDVIFDVGGGDGATSTWFSRWSDRVHVFEPSPANRRLIAEHHRIRGVFNAEVTAAAVSDTCGETTLFLKERFGHNSLGDDMGASRTVDQVRVPVTTLDAFAEERSIEHVGVLKVDVEGYEPEVFRGADRLLRNRRIDLVVFEYSPRFYRQRGLDPLAPVDVLEKRGYRVTYCDGRSIDREALAQSPQTDLLAEPRTG